MQNNLNFYGLTIKEALAQARAFLQANNVEGADYAPDLLLEHVLNCDHTQLYTHPELILHENQAAHFTQLLNRRVKGEPVAYIRGFKHFWDMDLCVSPDTLIPRPETEILVEQLCTIISKNRDKPWRILDLGTGSGAIILTLTKILPKATAIATDVSPKALAMASCNAKNNGLQDRVKFIESDWFGALPEGEEFDFIVSNPPYIKSANLLNLQKEVRLFEPQLALNGGADGLECYREIISKAHTYLKPNGWLALETGERQHKEITQMLNTTGQYHHIKSIKDYANLERIMLAQKIA